MYCQRCHTCGTRLMKVLDGEEWCPTCEQYRRYKSHGWTAEPGDDAKTPCIELRPTNIRRLEWDDVLPARTIY